MTTPLTLTSFGHACVNLRHAGGSLVIDPGAYGDLTALESADAVLVTHDHVDHVAAEPLVVALARRPRLEVWGPDDVVDLLVGAGAPLERLHRVAAGDTFAAAGLDVEVLGEWHAVVHPDVPRAHNVAYLVAGTVLHPGDSFTAPASGRAVRVLLAPVAGPWLKISETIDYVRAVGAQTVVPIHDAVLSDAGRQLVDRLVSGLGHAGDYRRLATGEHLILD